MSNCESLKKTGTRIQLTLKIVKKMLKYGEHIMWLGELEIIRYIKCRLPGGKIK